MRLCILLLILCLPGCLSLHGKAAPVAAMLPIPPGMPRELQKTTLPDYIIEPPDILRIEVTRLIPTSPYFLGPGDGLLVQASRPDGTLVLDQVLNVELDGTLQFGSPFDDPNGETVPILRVDGPITVAGITVAEARTLITSHLGKTLVDPSVRVSLSEFAVQQPVSGEHLVAMDGTVNLGVYGQVQVTGLTVEEARIRINSHLCTYLQSPNASVDVYAYNSKNYYIILQGAGLGDQLMQFPITGNETVLDALANVQGLSGTSSDQIWIARPGRNVFDGHQMLPVNWCGITEQADPSTNYQILPGDRVFVRENALIAADTHLGQFIAPLERIFGVVTLGTNTVSRIQFYKNFGRNGGGFGGGGFGGGGGGGF